MSNITNNAVRAQLPPAEMIAHFGGYQPTCQKCQSQLIVHDMQIHLKERPVNSRFPREEGEYPLIFNRLDLSTYCENCQRPSALIVMPTADDGELEYYYDGYLESVDPVGDLE
jgi:hypothetical protein